MGIRAFRAVAFWGLVLLAALVALGVYQLPQEWRAPAVVWLMVGLPLVLVLARIWIAWAKAEEAKAHAAGRHVTIEPASAAPAPRREGFRLRVTEELPGKKRGRGRLVL